VALTMSMLSASNGCSLACRSYCIKDSWMCERMSDALPAVQFQLFSAAGFPNCAITSCGARFGGSAACPFRIHNVRLSHITLAVVVFSRLNVDQPFMELPFSGSTRMRHRRVGHYLANAEFLSRRHKPDVHGQEACHRLFR
jgi:hypothetical protein